MIRNKTPSLIHSKKNHPNPNPRPIPQNLLTYQPEWFQQYYHNKQLLSRINASNRNIGIMTTQYQRNPSVYALRQLEKMITDNCQAIQEVDRWVNCFRFSGKGTALYQTEKVMIGHFQSLLTEQITSVFANKQLITSVNAQLDHQSSFSQSYMNNSFTRQPNPNLNTSFQAQDRNKVFNEVTYKIQNLNTVLRRMNALVVGQGDLINRIDQNLIAGQENLVKANQQLKSRADREEGAGEFTCQGKVNKVITGLYGVNLVIILLFLLKHLIF